jgi:hypothetical protein
LYKELGGDIMIEQIYATVCATNDELIRRGEKIESQVFFVKGEQSKAHPIKYTKDKNVIDNIQEIVKSTALKEGVDGYIIILDTKITFVKQVGEKRTILKHDNKCVSRGLYMPRKKITELVAYKDKTILDKKRIIGRANMADNWDAWNELEIVGKE